MQYDENAEEYGYEGEMTPIECDELKAYKGDVYIPVYGSIADAQVYLKEKADAVIEEKNKEIVELKSKLDKAIAERDANQVCIDVLKEKLGNVDAGMRERRLKSALWLARANHADTMQKYNIECKCDGWVHRVNKWVDVERKCRAMAEKWR